MDCSPSGSYSARAAANNSLMRSVTSTSWARARISGSLGQLLVELGAHGSSPQVGVQGCGPGAPCLCWPGTTGGPEPSVPVWDLRVKTLLLCAKSWGPQEGETVGSCPVARKHHNFRRLLTPTSGGLKLG